LVSVLYPHLCFLCSRPSTILQFLHFCPIRILSVFRLRHLS
jgi:hypothetical protein